MNVEKPCSLLNKVHRNSARKVARAVQLQARRVQLGGVQFVMVIHVGLSGVQFGL